MHTAGSSAMSWFLLNQKMLATQANRGIKTKECIYLPHSHGSVYTVTGQLLEKGTEKHHVDCGRSHLFGAWKKEIRLNKALHYRKHSILKQEKQEPKNKQTNKNLALLRMDYWSSETFLTYNFCRYLIILNVFISLGYPYLVSLSEKEKENSMQNYYLKNRNIKEK